MVLVCHVILQYRLIKALCHFKVSYHPAKFDDHRHSGSRDIMVFVCHVNLQDQVIKVLNNIMVRSPSRHVTRCARFYMPWLQSTITVYL